MQIYLKKGFPVRARVREAFSVNMNCVVTVSIDDVNVSWGQKVCDTPKESMLAMEKMDWRGSPLEQLTNKGTGKDYVLDQCVAGSVPAACIGRHGVPGELYPPVDLTDDHHEWFISQIHGNRI